MKNNFIFLGIPLLIGGGIILSSIFWGNDKIANNTQVVEYKKIIEDSQLESSRKKNKENSLTIVTKISEKETLKNAYKNNRTEDFPKIESNQARQFKRMLAMEHRNDKILERKRYQSTRRAWRKSLNVARKEAKISGDYSKYEIIKSNEPRKN